MAGWHECIGGGCEHTDLAEKDSEQKIPLRRDSYAMTLVRDLLLDRRFLGTMKYYVNARLAILQTFPAHHLALIDGVLFLLAHLL